jgi:hypothetical protein
MGEINSGLLGGLPSGGLADESPVKVMLEPQSHLKSPGAINVEEVEPEADVLDDAVNRIVFVTVPPSLSITAEFEPL